MTGILRSTDWSRMYSNDSRLTTVLSGMIQKPSASAAIRRNAGGTWSGRETLSACSVIPCSSAA